MLQCTDKNFLLEKVEDLILEFFRLDEIIASNVKLSGNLDVKESMHRCARLLRRRLVEIEPLNDNPKLNDGRECQRLNSRINSFKFPNQLLKRIREAQMSEAEEALIEFISNDDRKYIVSKIEVLTEVLNYMTEKMGDINEK